MDIEHRVKKTIKEHGLLRKSDKIIVACSGGKDSTSVLYFLKKFGYDVEALHLDLIIGERSEKNLKGLKKFCKSLGVKLHVVNIRGQIGCSICYARKGIQAKKRLSNCMICGVVKRWVLNKKARELKGTKLVTGHNLDDEAENVLMNLMKGNVELGASLGPKTGVVEDKRFVQRVKPLYFCSNSEVREFSRKMQFPVIYEACPCLVGTLRKKVRGLLAELEKASKGVKMKIVRNFLEVLPLLKKKVGKGKLRECGKCGEPSRRDVCKRCELLGILRK